MLFYSFRRETRQLPWFTTFTVGTSGMFFDSKGVGLGAVVIALRDAPLRVLCVRKSTKSGYEFGGLWALPGGMVRSGSSIEGNLDDCILSSLKSRCLSEANLIVASDSDLSPVPEHLPITRYSVDGEQRSTLVTAYLFLGERPDAPRTSDPSVTEARWCNVEDVIPLMSPASCIILSECVWARLDADRQDLVRPFLEEARTFCSNWTAALPGKDWVTP